MKLEWSYDRKTWNPVIDDTEFGDGDFDIYLRSINGSSFVFGDIEANEILVHGNTISVIQ